MSKVYHLTTPVTEEQVRQLRVGDVVYLDGTVFTGRDRVHETLIEMDQKGEKPPFDLHGCAIWHCGPVSKPDGKGSYVVTSVGPTTSFRLTNETPFMLEKHGVRMIIGKGGMGFPAVDAMKKFGAVFLAATGGCACVYAQQVVRVKDVHWAEEVGLGEAAWELEVKDLGALVVAIDSTGETLYKKVMDQAIDKMPGLYKELDVKTPDRAVIHWPTALSGTKNVLEGMEKVGGGA